MNSEKPANEPSTTAREAEAPETCATGPSLNSESGATLVEFSLSCLLFFFLLIGGMEMMRLGYNVLITEYASSWALRKAVVNQVADLNKADPTNRANDVETQLITFMRNMGITVDDSKITICATSGSCAADADSAGEAEELISVSINYNVPLLMGLGTYKVSSIVFGRNEPF